MTMKIRPIRTDDDLNRAIARVNELWGAEEGTDSGDELSVLAVLISDYEQTHHRRPAAALSDPADVVSFKMRELALNRAEVAQRLGWSVEQLDQILDGHREMLLREAREIADVLGLAGLAG